MVVVAQEQSTPESIWHASIVDAPDLLTKQTGNTFGSPVDLEGLKHTSGFLWGFDMGDVLT